MLALLVPVLLMLFLAVGGAVFFVCVLLPPLRRYALSAALWCAMWGPCLSALILLAGTAMLADVSITQHNGVSSFRLPHLSHSVSWAMGVCLAAMIAAVATGVARLHQAAIHRMTFALFRLYATVVCIGIGGVFGVWLGWWVIGQQLRFTPFLAIGVILVLTISFGAGGWRGARALRGSAPANFTWITEQEFNGI